MTVFISLNQFIDVEFKSCFVCGGKKYCEFYVNDHIYRICAKCLKKKKISNFFAKRSKT